MGRAKTIRLVLTGILQLIGLLVVVGVSNTLFQIEPGTSALQNTFVIAGLVALVVAGLGLIFLGHRLR
ncbi:MAG TPA: hypothetical protein VNP90_08260 [Actinomycetota bacterium]|nr:hypothetical protein [Actinomycetota bacterium]